MGLKSKEQVVANAQEKIESGIAFDELNHREQRLYGKYLAEQKYNDETVIAEQKTVEETTQIEQKNVETEIATKQTKEETKKFSESISLSQQLTTLQSQLQTEKEELNNARSGQGKEVRKVVKEYFNDGFKKIDNRINETLSGEYSNLNIAHIQGLILKATTLLASARDYKSQLVTGDIDEAKRFFPPNIFDDANFYVPDVKPGDYDKNNKKQDITSSNITIKECNNTPVIAKDAKEAFEKGGIVGAMDYRGAKSNLDPKMRAFSRGAAFLGLAGLGIRGIKKLYGSFKEGGRRKTPAVLIGGSIGLNMLSGSMTGKPFGLTDIFKGFALGGNDLPKRLLSVGEVVINKAGNLISDNKDKNQTAMEVVQPQLISSYFLRDIPFSDLMQPISLSDGTTDSIIKIENNQIKGCNVEALQMYINSKTNIDPDIKKERQNYIDTYNTKSDTDKEKIQQLFIGGLTGLGITNAIIKNNPTHNLADNHYKPKLDELAKNAEQEKKQQEKINNSGEIYDGKDIAKVKPYLIQINGDITDPKIKEKYTVDFQARLEKKLNILYMQHPKSGPISIYFDKTTNKLNIKSYNQIVNLDILSENNIISTPYSATSRAASSLEEAINIGQLHNLLTAPASLGFAGASTVDNPFNLSYTETERDIEFNKTDRWTAMKNRSFKQGTDTTILYDTRANNFDENFPSINNKKSEFINWLNNFKKNGKSLWKI